MATAYRASEYVSASSRLAFGRESNFSVAVAPTKFLGITNAGFSFPDVQKDVREYYSFGSGSQLFQTRFGKNTRSSTISFLPTTAELFYYSMGQDNAFDGEGLTAASLPPGTTTLHVMEPVDDSHLPSMTLWGALKGNPNFTRSFPGTIAGNFTATLSEGGELQVSMSVQPRAGGADFSHPPLFGQPTSDGTIGAPPTPFMFYDRNALIQIMGSYQGPLKPLSGGRTVARVRGFNMSFTRNVQVIMSFLDGTTPVSPAGSLPDDPRNPLTFTVGSAATTLSLEVTPAGDFSDGTPGTDGALYDILQNEIEGDILIPFRRTRVTPTGTVTDALDFVFEGCKLRSAPHDFPEDRNAVTVSCDVSVTRFKIVAADRQGNYAGVTS